MTNKQIILDEIRRISAENGGKAPGRQKFENETGIKAHEWYPHIFMRWGDAIAEAGLTPNELNRAFDKSKFFEAYVGLVQELGRLPLDGEIRRKARGNPEFPGSQTFLRQFGVKADFIRALSEYCQSTNLHPDIVELCKEYQSRSPSKKSELKRQSLGFVYLMKSGRHYKIGFTNAAGRREYELGIQLPNELKTIHVIKTDDPSGVEAYWHKRFEGKRVRGEWFDLDPADVSAFKRTKNIG